MYLAFISQILFICFRVCATATSVENLFKLSKVAFYKAELSERKKRMTSLLLCFYKQSAASDQIKETSSCYKATNQMKS